MGEHSLYSGTSFIVCDFRSMASFSKSSCIFLWLTFLVLDFSVPKTLFSFSIINTFYFTD